MFGDAINLSARLMVKCKKGAAEVLCDEPTYLQAKYRARYSPLEPMQLKVGGVMLWVLNGFQYQTFDGVREMSPS